MFVSPDLWPCSLQPRSQCSSSCIPLPRSCWCSGSRAGSSPGPSGQQPVGVRPSPTSHPAAGMSLLSAGESHDVTLSGTACSCSSSTTGPSLQQQQQQLSLEGQGVPGDHGGPPALAQHAGTDLLWARTRAFNNLYTHGHTQRPEALMLPLSQDAFIEKTLPQELLILLIPSPPSPAAGAEQHLEGKVLKVLLLGYLFLEDTGSCDALVQGCRAEHGGRAAARAAGSLLVSPHSLQLRPCRPHHFVSFRQHGHHAAQKVLGSSPRAA